MADALKSAQQAVSRALGDAFGRAAAYDPLSLVQGGSIDSIALDRVETRDISLEVRLAEKKSPYVDGTRYRVMGVDSRTLSVDAKVIGPSWRARRDAILALARTQSEDEPIEFIDPNLGAISALIKSCKCVESDDRVGEARFSLALVEVGVPGSERDAATRRAKEKQLGLLQSSLAALDDASRTLSEAVDLATLPAREIIAEARRVRAQVVVATARIRAALDSIGETQSEALALVDDLIGDSQSLGVFATRLFAPRRGATDRAADASDIQDALDIGAPTETLVDIAAAIATPPSHAAIGSTPSALAVARMQDASDLWILRSLLALASKSSTSEPYATWQDAIRARDRLCAELLRAGLYSLSSDAYDSLTHVAEGLASLVHIDVYTPRSALELAYELYADATRADEIMRRNDIIDANHITGRLLVLEA